jgi:hypothetical protein
MLDVTAVEERPEGLVPGPPQDREDFFFLVFFLAILFLFKKESEMDEDLKRAIEDLHVVSSVSFHAGIRLIKQASMPTSGVLKRLRMEDAARSWWGPCRPNFLRCVTAYANLDD